VLLPLCFPLLSCAVDSASCFVQWYSCRLFAVTLCCRSLCESYDHDGSLSCSNKMLKRPQYIIAAPIPKPAQHYFLPPQLWIIGYASGCFATLPILHWRYTHRRGRTRQSGSAQVRQHQVQGKELLPLSVQNQLSSSTTLPLRLG
jgi:hypothetical protein